MPFGSGLVVLFVFWLFSPTPVSADNILSIAGNCSSQGALRRFFSFGVFWTQTTSYYNVSIDILATTGFNATPEDGTPILAFLTHKLLSGTTASDEVARTTFTIPPGTPRNTPIRVFTGLTLPGTATATPYYLTLYAPTQGNAGGWCTASFLTTPSVGPGVTEQWAYELNGYEDYPPGGGFIDYEDPLEVSISGMPGTPPAPQTGTITVNTNLASATFALAPSVPGAPSGGPYPVVISNAPAGQYSIKFNDVQGYTTPSLPPQALTAGATISFNAQYVVSPPTATNTIIFDASQMVQSQYLGDDLGRQVSAQIDSQGTQHTYHVFAVEDNGRGALLAIADPSVLTLAVDHSALSLALAPENSGSAMTLALPSGGDSSDSMSGGMAQFLIPFGISVNAIDGINVTFGNPTSPIQQSLACAARVGLDAVAGYVFGVYYTGFQLLGCAAGLVPQQTPCTVTYPILNDQSAACLADPNNNSLFGDKALNTHQIRTIRWKPSLDGFSRSAITFHLDQPPSQVMSLIQQKGITIYVNTPRGDFWLDNFH